MLDDAQSPIYLTFTPQNVVDEYPIGTVTYERNDVDENQDVEHDDGSVVSSYVTDVNAMHFPNA